jgi:hypothetical protein
MQKPLSQHQISPKSKKWPIVLVVAAIITLVSVATYLLVRKSNAVFIASTTVAPTSTSSPSSTTTNTSTTKPSPSSVFKGVCYFDIDNTLSTSPGSKKKSDGGDHNESVMKACTDAGFAIGIITASERRIENTCTGDNPPGSWPDSAHWMPPSLCKQLNQDGGTKMFNSSVIVAGREISQKAEPPYPEDYPTGSNGIKKKFAMEFGRSSFFPSIPQECVVLFDDDKDNIKAITKPLESQLVNNSTDSGALTGEFVSKKLKSMNC